MAHAIEIEGLRKTYGDIRALDGVDLAVPEGSVFGFLGPNGAGKTTTLRILTGLADPTEGTGRIFGLDVVRASAEVRAAIGFLPDVPGFYGWMDAAEYLRFSGRLFGLGGADLEARVEALLDLSGLAGVPQRIGGYSRGMKQRLGVAQALVSAPRLLLLDEPTSALDPMGRRDVLEMIASLRGRTTVFFSTHVLGDVERVCDAAAILDRGRVVRQASIAQLKERGGESRLRVEVSSGAGELASTAASTTWCVESSSEGGVVSLTVSDLEAARRDLPRLVSELSLALVSLEEQEPTLEEVFMDLVGGGP